MARPMAKDEAPRDAAKEFVANQEPGAPNVPPQAEKQKEKPRKIRYTADMKLVVEKLDDAEEALDMIRKEAMAEPRAVSIVLEHLAQHGSRLHMS